MTRDVTDADFDTAVLQRSQEVPVVVDFWAPWCGPCRHLGPILERLGDEAAGGWELVKVDVDKSPRVASQFRIRSIPAVKAFKQGRVVAEFVGALPEAQVRAFVSRLLPTAADRAVQTAAEALARGDAEAAEAAYREALADEAHHKDAIVGLAEVLADRGAAAEALALLDRAAGVPKAEALRARLSIAKAGASVDLPALEARVAADPKDAQARYDLGRGLAARGEYEAALDQLLEAVRLDRKLDDDGARKAMLDVFRLLGDDDERTRTYRRLLSTAL